MAFRRIVGAALCCAGLNSLATPAAERSALDRLRFPAHHIVATCTYPLRRIELISGETLTGEILRGDPAGVELRLFGAVRLRIPRRAIRQIAALPGERVRLEEHFADADSLQVRFEGDDPPEIRRGALIVPANGRRVEILLPEGGKEFRCSFRLRAAHEEKIVPLVWSAHFGDGTSLQARLDARGNWRMRDSAHAGSGPGANWHSGWQSVRLRSIGARLYVSIDDQLLFSGTAPSSGMTGLEFAALPGVSGVGGEIAVDDLLVVEASESNEMPAPQASAEAIVSGNGETWWGDVANVGPDGVEWSNEETTWHRSWREVQGVVFRPSPDPIAGPTLAGKIVEVELASPADRPDVPGDRLTAVLGSQRGSYLLADHPLLGRLALPVAAIRQIRSRFLGGWQLRDARETALGASQPELQGEFTLDGPTAGSTFLAADFSGLEPSGPRTPPGSPTLRELRAGRWATELFVNDRRLGTFNELTSDWSLSGRFDRLRFPLPADALKTGRNTWRIQQTPGGVRNRPVECRLRNVAVEIDVP